MRCADKIHALWTRAERNAIKEMSTHILLGRIETKIIEVDLATGTDQGREK